MRFANRVAIVTGASRGIGRAIALALAKEGCDVVAAAKTDQPDPKLPGTIRETAREVVLQGRRGLAIQVDVRNEGAIAAMVDQTVETLGRVDFLIHNAGAIYLAPVAETPSKRFDLVMGVNVRAAFVGSQAVIPVMRRQGG
ncbi:MAG: SDR family NAD(P)-dependent oxidoreductase, partial [Cyanobacteria bacterium REEB65]|nr:SDR family NAD(P)-dependent oxidoreductase [Cyanobacteria bacterium REEB65]